MSDAAFLSFLIMTVRMFVENGWNFFFPCNGETTQKCDLIHLSTVRDFPPTFIYSLVSGCITLSLSVFPQRLIPPPQKKIHPVLCSS